MCADTDKNGSSPAITTDGAGQTSSVLALGHHNLAVEQEVLGHYRAALNSYDGGVPVRPGGLGEDHKLTRAIHKNANAALTSIERKLQGDHGQQHTADRVRKSREILNSKSKRVGNRPMERRRKPIITTYDEKENMVNTDNPGGSGADGKGPDRYLDFIKEENAVILPASGPRPFYCRQNRGSPRTKRAFQVCCPLFRPYQPPSFCRLIFIRPRPQSPV